LTGTLGLFSEAWRTLALRFHCVDFCVNNMSTLANGTYELILKSESEQREAQANLTQVIEDSNQSSEEPKANFA
jgi:hypothetical protein